MAVIDSEGKGGQGAAFFLCSGAEAGRQRILVHCLINISLFDHSPIILQQVIQPRDDDEKERRKFSKFGGEKTRPSFSYTSLLKYART